MEDRIIVPNEGKDLSSTVHLDTVAGSHQDETEDPDDHGQDKTMGTAPSIE